MRIFPLNISQVGCLKNILEERIKEAGMQEHTSVQDSLVKLEKGYSIGITTAYADSIESPKCCLIMGHSPGLVHSSTIASIIVLHVDKENRGNLELLDMLLKVAEAYARTHAADALVGSSWIYRGHKPMDSFWLRHDFEPKETVFIKHLT